jgi:hypothetical protein
MLFSNAVSCSSVHGSFTKSFSVSDFCALSVELCAEVGCFVVSTCGVLDVARDESFGRFLGGILMVDVGSRSID